VRDLRPGELKLRTLFIVTVAFVLAASIVMRVVFRSWERKTSSPPSTPSSPSTQGIIVNPTPALDSVRLRLAGLTSRLDSLQIQVDSLETKAHRHPPPRAPRSMLPQRPRPDSSTP